MREKLGKADGVRIKRKREREREREKDRERVIMDVKILK